MSSCLIIKNQNIPLLPVELNSSLSHFQLLPNRNYFYPSPENNQNVKGMRKTYFNSHSYSRTFWCISLPENKIGSRQIGFCLLRREWRGSHLEPGSCFPGSEPPDIVLPSEIWPLQYPGWFRSLYLSFQRSPTMKN